MEDVRIIEKLPSKEKVELESLSITENGEYTSDRGKAYNSISVDVSGGGSSGGDEVRFIDYDGTIVQTYSAEDFLALDALPDNPTHQGLTAQGWNWTLADAKTHVTKYTYLDIGQNYITDDGATRVYISLEKGRLSPILRIYLNGAVQIDWGDNTAVESATTSSLSHTSFSHTYSNAGDYTIKIIPDKSSSVTIQGGTQTSYLLNRTIDNSIYNKNYSACIHKIELGRDVLIGDNAFNHCVSLKSISLPNGITTIGNNSFIYCTSLKSVTLPNSITAIGVTNVGGPFSQCYSLESCTIPNANISISNSSFNSCSSLQRIVFPDKVTSIGNIFNNCVSLKKVVWTGSSISGFSGCYSLEEVIISDNVNTISGSTFYKCYTLKGLKLDNITSIGSNAFEQCWSIKSFTIPEVITAVSVTCLSQCSSLSSITIHDKITSIGAYAFNGCVGLGFIKFEGTTAPSVGASNAFSSLPNDCKIYIPFVSLVSYLTGTNYPNSSTYTYIGFGTYTNGETLPTQDTTQAYNVVWYATKEDAIAQTNPITEGNGEEIYCRYTAV